MERQLHTSALVGKAVEEAVAIELPQVYGAARGAERFRVAARLEPVQHLAFDAQRHAQSREQRTGPRTGADDQLFGSVPVESGEDTDVAAAVAVAGLPVTDRLVEPQDRATPSRLLELGHHTGLGAQYTGARFPHAHHAGLRSQDWEASVNLARRQHRILQAMHLRAVTGAFNEFAAWRPDHQSTGLLQQRGS